MSILSGVGSGNGFGNNNVNHVSRLGCAQRLNEMEFYVRHWHQSISEELNTTWKNFSSALKELEIYVKQTSSPVQRGKDLSGVNLHSASNPADIFSPDASKPLPWQNITGLNLEGVLSPDLSSTPSVSNTGVYGHSKGETNAFSDLMDDVVPKANYMAGTAAQTASKTNPPSLGSIKKSISNNANSNNMNMSVSALIPPSPSSNRNASLGATPVKSSGNTGGLTHAGNDTSKSAGAATSNLTLVCCCLIEFKRKTMRFDSPFEAHVGDHILVFADRGEDIGLVIRVWKYGTFDQVGDSYGPSKGVAIRPASLLEVTQMSSVQKELEKRAIEVAQEEVAKQELPMKIVDAVYQFDRKKLTFYYTSEHRLDFRTLLRELYKIFRARIWLEHADNEQ